MRKLKFILLAGLLLFSGNVYSREVIVGFEEKDLPVLNESLKELSDRIDDKVSLTAGVTGILPLANGGTGSDHSGTVSGGIFYFSDTGVISVLAKGSDGESLSLLSGLPAWATVAQDVKLLSVTSVSGASNSGNITIEPSKYYYVVIKMTVPSAEAFLALRFNSDSTSTGYAWVYNNTEMDTTPVVATVGDNSDSLIRLTGTANKTIGWIKLNMFIDTYKIGTTVSATVTSQGTYFSPSTFFHSVEGYGAVQLNLTITDFEVFPGAGTADFDVRVYELIQS